MKWLENVFHDIISVDVAAWRLVNFHSTIYLLEIINKIIQTYLNVKMTLY